jgi:hypothetical protein
MRFISCLALFISGLAAQDAVPRWSRFETSFTAAQKYAAPVHDVRLDVAFTAPSGKRHVIRSFWDGGATWRVRFSPDETGGWRWQSSATPSSDAGLHGRKGQFTCAAYSGTNAIYRQGPIGVAESRYHFQTADGRPFFWLGDTVWNGPLKASAADWDRFLNDRRAKRFNVMQYIATSWRAGPGDENGRTAWKGRDRIEIDIEFFRRMDARVNTINDHGMHAAPVLLWANRFDSPENPTSLPEDQMILLARYMIARYGAHQVVWLLNGDGQYTGPNAERWKRIGRAVFAGGHPGRIATLHPARGTWMREWYKDEDWFNFIGYQSGHRDLPDELRWLLEGPPAQDWRKEPRFPFLNIEPNYEAHNSRSAGSKHVFNDHDMRRAAYWSNLVAPPAGLTYGAHGIWSWEHAANEPLGHKGTGIAPPWQDAMKLAGSAHMKHLRDLFESLEWWRLRPAPELLAEQPGTADPARFIAAARTEDGKATVIYAPVGSVIRLKSEPKGRAQWFDPRTGQYRDARVAPEINTPDQQDWVLVTR